ncbi:MAG: hypothetical protein HOV66_17495 [Streptomycetaceae bacterium]|nr:hypothetical protein [Streptomycetaceae bacterium]
MIRTLVADDIPNPKPKAPTQGIATDVSTLLSWGSWIVMAICGVAILACAGRMAMAHKSGADGGQHLMGLVWIVVAAILVGSGAAALNTIT